MRYILFFLLLAFFGCTPKNDFELKIITKEIKSLNIEGIDYVSYIAGSTPPPSNSITVLTYSIKNNSNKTYYFNIDGADSNLPLEYIRINKAFLKIYDSKNAYVKPRVSQPSLRGELSQEDLINEYLNYDYPTRFRNRNFIIHPNETLYFEWFTILPFGSLIENINYFMKLDSTEKYSAEIFISSNDKNLKLFQEQT